MADEEITTGELGRRIEQMRSDVRDDLQELRSSVRDDLQGVRNQISQLSFVSTDRYNAEQDAQDKAIKALEDAKVRHESQRATDRRLALTSLVAPIMVAIVTALILAAISGGP